MFRIVGGGGSSVADVLQRERSTVVAPLAAVVDSDRTRPGGAMGNTAVTAARTARALEREGPPAVLLHTLQRRNLENYLPVGRTVGPGADAYRGLAPTLRHYLHLKEGWSKDARKGPDGEPPPAPTPGQTPAWKDPLVAEARQELDHTTITALWDKTALRGPKHQRLWAEVKAEELRDEAGEELTSLANALIDLL